MGAAWPWLGSRWCFGAGEGKSDGAEMPVLAFPPGSAALSSSGEHQEAIAFLARFIPPRALKQALFPHGAAVKCSLTAASL